MRSAKEKSPASLRLTGLLNATHGSGFVDHAASRNSAFTGSPMIRRSSLAHAGAFFGSAPRATLLSPRLI